MGSQTGSGCDVTHVLLKAATGVNASVRETLMEGARLANRARPMCRVMTTPSGFRLRCKLQICRSAKCTSSMSWSAACKRVVMTVVLGIRQARQLTLTRCFSAAAAAASRRMRSASAVCRASLSASLAAACNNRSPLYHRTGIRDSAQRVFPTSASSTQPAERPADTWSCVCRENKPRGLAVCSKGWRPSEPTADSTHLVREAFLIRGGPRALLQSVLRQASLLSCCRCQSL